MAFDCAFGFALELRLWVSNWFWLSVVTFDLVVAFNLAIVFGCGYRYSFGLSALCAIVCTVSDFDLVVLNSI